MRKPTIRLLLLGTVAGGIPLSIAFSRLGGRFVSPEFLRYMVNLTPLALVVTLIGSLWTREGGRKALIWKAFVTSFAACVPLPLLVSSVLMVKFGYALYSPSGLPVLVCVFILWTFAVALISSLLAGAVLFFLRAKNAGQL